MSKRILAWHFLRPGRRLGYDDERLVVVGRRFQVKGPPVLYQHGLHAFARAIDALNYAASPVVARVLVGGQVVRGPDRLAGTTLEAVAIADASAVLRAWARWCALQVADLWTCSPPGRKHLLTGTGELSRAAADAAEDAAWAAAAARAAARDAAEDDAWAEAWAEAVAAVEAEAWAETWARSVAVARSADSAEVEASPVDRPAASAVTVAAARFAAWNSTRDAQNAELERRLKVLLECE